MLPRGSYGVEDDLEFGCRRNAHQRGLRRAAARNARHDTVAKLCHERVDPCLVHLDLLSLGVDEGMRECGTARGDRADLRHAKAESRR